MPTGSQVRLTATVARAIEIEGGVQLVADAVLEVDGAPKPACVARPGYRYFT